MCQRLRPAEGTAPRCSGRDPAEACEDVIGVGSPAVGVLLVVLGAVGLALGLLLAFTVYGMAALAVGAVCSALGIVRLVGRPRAGGNSPRTPRR